MARSLSLAAAVETSSGQRTSVWILDSGLGKSIRWNKRLQQLSQRLRKKKRKKTPPRPARLEKRGGEKKGKPRGGSSPAQPENSGQRERRNRELQFYSRRRENREREFRRSRNRK